MHTLALPRCSNRWNNGGAVTSYRFASPPQSSKGVIFRRILDEHFEALSPMPPSTSLPAGSKGSTTKSRPCGARVMAIQTMITSSSSSSMSAESLTSGILHPTMFMIDPKFSWNYVRTCYARSYISRSA